MEQPRINKDSGDGNIYIASLSQINIDRERILRKLESLKLQGKTEDDLEVKGYKFNLEELNKIEEEIKENIQQKK